MKHARGWLLAIMGVWCWLSSSSVFGAEAPTPADTTPSYMIPNIVALIMIAAVISIASKPFKPTE